MSKVKNKQTLDWEKSRAEKYDEKYWKKHGYHYQPKRKYMSKSVYLVSKDGVEVTYDIPYSVTDPVKFMKFFADLFDMHTKLQSA